MTRLIVFLATTAVFTILGIVVGHLVASGVLQANRTSSNVGFEVALAYISCSIGGLVAGFVISCFGLWLFSPTARN